MPPYSAEYPGRHLIVSRWPERLSICLAGLGLLIEIYDTDSNPPKDSAPRSTRKAAGALMLVEALSKEWSYFFSRRRQSRLLLPGDKLIRYHDISQLTTYYSCCFSVCDHTAAQRGSWLRCDGYVVSPPSGRRGSGGQGCQAGGVVVPAGAIKAFRHPTGGRPREAGRGGVDVTMGKWSLRVVR
jgi:hypothetical protein